MIELLGQSPLNSAVVAGRSQFTSLFRTKPSNAYAEEAGRYPRPYTSQRGILINKDFLLEKPLQLDKGYYFQFNPQTVSDIKNTLYETRSYAGLSFNDYTWAGGGERLVTFQLFMDNTPQSKIRSFRPTAINNSKEALTLKVDGVNVKENGLVDIEYSQAERIRRELGVSIEVAKGASKFEFVGDAYSSTRVHQRGILPEVELIQSYLYPAPLKGEETPMFASGGVISSAQFRPPPTVVLSIGPIYLEGVIKSAPVEYTLFDADLTPIRGSIDIEFAVFEFETISKPEELNSPR